MVSLEDSGEPAGAFTATDRPPALPATYTDAIRYAGFWIRLVAYVIDTILVDIIILIAFFPVAVLMAARETLDGTPHDPGLVGVAMNVLTLVFTLLYYGLFTASKWQATPGKRLLGLHIVGTDGRKLRFGLGVGRFFAYFLSSIILGVGFFMIGWSDQKKGMHDILCRTRVIHGRPRVSDLATVFE
jgi:uncharacterized RDD family membrane protein YckC